MLKNMHCTGFYTSVVLFIYLRWCKLVTLENNRFHMKSEHEYKTYV